MKTKYSPKLGKYDRVVEADASYIKRMQATLLPNFPAEVLKEWFHRHWDSVDEYDILPFEKLLFREENRPLEAIPGGEAYRDPLYFDELSDYSHYDWRLSNEHDPLPRYMKKNGTWNTPPIFFENLSPQFTGELHSPWHLLEGHRRVGLLHALASQGLAIKTHRVFICRLGQA